VGAVDAVFPATLIPAAKERNATCRRTQLVVINTKRIMPINSMSGRTPAMVPVGKIYVKDSPLPFAVMVYVDTAKGMRKKRMALEEFRFQ